MFSPHRDRVKCKYWTNSRKMRKMLLMKQGWYFIKFFHLTFSLRKYANSLYFLYLNFGLACFKLSFLFKRPFWIFSQFFIKRKISISILDVRVVLRVWMISAICVFNVRNVIFQYTIRRSVKKTNRRRIISFKCTPCWKIQKPLKKKR